MPLPVNGKKNRKDDERMGIYTKTGWDSTRYCCDGPHVSTEESAAVISRDENKRAGSITSGILIHACTMMITIQAET